VDTSRHKGQPAEIAQNAQEDRTGDELFGRDRDELCVLLGVDAPASRAPLVKVGDDVMMAKAADLEDVRVQEDEKVRRGRRGLR
jgi:hypothetical protein